MLFTLRNSRGQSLIQVMIVAGIGTVLMLAIVSMQTSQSRENQSLAEKLASSDFQQQLTRSFMDGTVCKNLLTLPTALQFDPTNAVVGNPNPPSMPVPGLTSALFTGAYIPASTDAGAPPLAIAGKPVSPIAQTVQVVTTATAFQVVNLVGVHDAVGGTYTGSFQVSYDNTKMVRAIKPATVQVVLQTATTGPLQSVTGCSSKGTFGAFQIITATVQETHTPTGVVGSPGETSAATCPAGYTLALSYLTINHATWGGPGPGGWHYCDCTNVGNTMTVQLQNSGPTNPNGACSCNGLCLPN